MKKKVCKVCGAEIPAESRYCSECGARQPATVFQKRVAAVCFSFVAFLMVNGIALHFILRSQENVAREKATADSACESIAVQQTAYEIAMEVAVRDSLMADSTASGR